MQRPCASSVSTFVTGFGSAGDRGSAAVVLPRPGTIDVPGSAAGSGSAAGLGSAAGPGSAAGQGSQAGAGAASAVPDLERYEHLRPGMTDDEVKAVIERARVKAAGSGSAH